jgi:hypothetical protein
MLAAQAATFLFGESFSSGKKGGSLGGMMGSLVSMLGFREAGGPVEKGKPYVVGEKRPEIFVPSVNGNILPDATGAGIAPQQTQVSIHVTAMDSQDVIRALDKVKRQVVEMVTGTQRTYNLGAR